jgi:hypothetical protein
MNDIKGALVGSRLAQHRVECHYDRHSQFAQERQYVTAGGAAKDSELVW